MHLVHISAREFNPMSQAVQVQKKLLRLALAARSPAASVLSPVAGALVCAQGIGDHLPQEGPDETHVRVKGARPQGAGVLTRLVFSGTTGVCHRSHLLPLHRFLICNITEGAW